MNAEEICLSCRRTLVAEDNDPEFCQECLSSKAGEYSGDLIRSMENLVESLLKLGETL